MSRTDDVSTNLVRSLFPDLDVLFALQKTAGDWYDGGNSAMNAFSLGRPFSPAKLVRETTTVLGGLTEPLRNKNEPRLKALLEAAERLQAHDRALRAVEKAMRTTSALGVDPYEVRRSQERGEANGRRDAQKGVPDRC